VVIESGVDPEVTIGVSALRELATVRWPLRKMSGLLLSSKTYQAD
jgi:hypothetical protein